MNCTVNCTPDGRYNRQQAAAYLGISAKTLANYAVRGLGPRCGKVGGRVFYFQDDLNSFIHQGWIS
ncbi:helix-turn-helix domain-containing protein [Sphingomonas sp. GC_Shp_3]|uniref:helix-turn-helix domain-containing protein n=1 Tax=Sphingomonas sp. GC_Shp_3 TaxID=2937383 RepID=UPI002269A507|nr:helix-turn-helix domain-containing protein [Sphingomonas sp. GC_Shp_3]